METFFCVYNFKNNDGEIDDNINVTNEQIIEDFSTYILNIENFCFGCPRVGEHFENFYVFCPSCCDCENNECEDFNVELQIDDYVDQPMIWCRCQGLIFLLKDTVKVVSKEYIESVNPKYFTALDDEKKTIFDDPKNKFVSVRNAFIKRMTDSRLDRFCSKKQLSSDETSQFSEDMEKSFNLYSCKEEDILNFLKSNSIAIKYNIEKRNENEYNLDSKEVLNIFVDVNSYDLNEPKIPYVPSISLSHDGVYIHVLCEDEKGNDFTSRVCGD